MAEFVGSIASEETARFGSSVSVRAAHDVPPLVVFHTPPATPAAYIVFGVVGSMTMARVRPPTLPGPRAVQDPRNEAAVSRLMPRAAADGWRTSPPAVGCSGISFICSRAWKYFSTGTW